MASGNVEIVRQMLDDYAHREFDQALSAFASDVVWESRIGERFHGREGVAEAVRRWTGAFADFEFEVQELIDSGDTVVMVLRQVGRGKGSGASVKMTMAWLYRLRNGKIIRVSMFADREDALTAAGRPADR
ncbi:MAG TPA: nuclear transport factor 2 family protein [Solirubrobacterales bacterium]|jgi:ketosteroid isomerase-like protein